MNNSSSSAASEPKKLSGKKRTLKQSQSTGALESYIDSNLKTVEHKIRVDSSMPADYTGDSDLNPIVSDSQPQRLVASSILKPILRSPSHKSIYELPSLPTETDKHWWVSRCVNGCSDFRASRYRQDIIQEYCRRCNSRMLPPTQVSSKRKLLNQVIGVQK